MTSLSIPTELSDLDKSIFLARHINQAVDVLRPLVYKVYAEKLWVGRFNSFEEYVESPDGLNKSQGYASKLKNVEKHYIIDGGLDPKDISGTDYECLYLAIKTEGTPKEQAERAKVWSRSDFKDEKKDTCANHEFIPMCKHCYKREA